MENIEFENIRELKKDIGELNVRIVSLEIKIDDLKNNLKFLEDSFFGKLPND